MRITDAPLAVLRFQYRIVRLPLQIIEERVVARMGSEAPARLFYERSLGLLDAAVGNALGDPRLAKRGGALSERSDALRRAAQLDATATQTRQQSSAELKAKSDKAFNDQLGARAAKEREVEEARTAAEERKRAAEEAAAKRTAAAKKQADDLAAQRTSSAEAAKREEEASIRANEQKATAAAKSKLDDAQARRTEADIKRAQADRVEEAADVEKQKRQSERANNR
ncbi:MAG: hypothetical protein QOJ20_3601 [Mycobacterium sp.]|jgi:flagellar biosynthesis GTPase FlhF|nr:hypothetical protein [Mycobacterium sp.]